MQGFNMGRYHPPDEENAPKFNTSHPLGARARKINQGILVVRFELPYAVWCETCKPPALIGQGVRFNAEKKKIGNYHSTPIFSFRFKHGACGGWLEIHTDPKNTAYVVAAGGRKRDYGPDERIEDGEMAFLTPEEREKRREDAFAALEGRVNEKGAEQKHRKRIDELLEAQQKSWDDPYERNQQLRREFRVKRKELKKEDEDKKSIQEKYGLGFDIADATIGDAVKAGMVDFSVGNEGDRVMKKSLFDRGRDPGKKDQPHAKDLQQVLVSNTRAALDPFLEGREGKTTKTASNRIPHLKRKQEPDEDSLPQKKAAPQCQTVKSNLSDFLPQYDSDSD